MNNQYLAIYDNKVVSRGSLEDIIYQVKALQTPIEPLVFEQQSCQRIDFSWHGDAATVLKAATGGNTTANKRGRPKLGVKAKEVTLLPRHWEWLSTQRGGASAALRRLIDEAQKNASTEDVICTKQQQLDKFMLTFLGDEPGFEEASRALYRNSKVSFEAAIATWSSDIKEFVMAKFMAISDLHSGATPT
ncbi:DUF2239 family protein [uncultured Paraglaciecola sp.]|uniref:DUF2239 family protein n=1 Tax=uncultured Paraglaciecola sp. TaxID=1765024 RepID=UPI0030D7959C|tara:strand:- start:90223 stop:90792 length:570 start_codon:yes stop_codon:yes gene_type:complete